VVLGGFLLATLPGLSLLFQFFKEQGAQERKSPYPLSGANEKPLAQYELAMPQRGQLPPPPRLEGIDAAIGQEGPDRVLKTQGHNLGRHAHGPTRLQAEEEEEELKIGGRPIDQTGTTTIGIEMAMQLFIAEEAANKPKTAKFRQDRGIPGTGGDANSGRLSGEEP
jgi:hypothetical protein